MARVGGEDLAGVGVRRRGDRLEILILEAQDLHVGDAVLTFVAEIVANDVAANAVLDDREVGTHARLVEIVGDVVAGAAVDGVVAVAALLGVGARAAQQDVVARAAGQRVVAEPAGERVVPGIADDRVVAEIAFEVFVAGIGRPEDRIHDADEGVVSGAAIG